jgi:hypothetical protein
MGLCRALNVACGAAAVLPAAGGGARGWGALAAVCAVWAGYIAGVTRYSAGEELDPAKRRRVGLLVGAVIHLQIVTLLLFYLFCGGTPNLVLAGAVLLVVMRMMKRLLPRVSAS